jgi:hypothetical protein
MKRIGVAIAMLAMIFASTASSEVIRISAQRTEIIQDPEGRSRILFDFGPLQSVEGEHLISAHLLIPNASGLASGEAGARVGMPATPWFDTEPSWTSPWQVPGGDWDSSPIVGFDPREGTFATSLSLDLSELARTVVETGGTWNGLILAPRDPSKSGFESAEMAFFESIAEAELVLRYRKLSALGIEDGGLQLLKRKRASRSESIAD